MTIEYEVNEEDVAHSGDWHIIVSCFRDLGQKVIDYKLELSLPDKQ